MKERLFFFAPGVEDAHKIIDDLTEFGVSENDLHVIAREDIALDPVAEPDLLHRSDLADAAKRGAATGGAMGLIGSILAISNPALGLTLGGGAILAGTALGGALGTWFSTMVGVSVPNQDVEEYRDRIERGELMIIVDSEPSDQTTLKGMLAAKHPQRVILQGNLDAA
ncbi:MAG: hypothetical protein KDI09_00905 [Halioglobus sp.]|nr:hypothetical protein [Halioglobus sp.]